MKRLLIFLLMLTVMPGFAQDSEIEDSLRALVTNAENDTDRIKKILVLSDYQVRYDPQGTFDTLQKALQTCEEKINDSLNLNKAEYRFYVDKRIIIYNFLGFLYQEMGNIEKALEYSHKSLILQENKGKTLGYALALNNIGLLYRYQGDLEKGLEYTLRCLEIRKKLDSKGNVADAYWNTALTYGDMKDTTGYNRYMDSAAYHYAKLDGPYGRGSVYFVKATKANFNKQVDSAIYYFMKVIPYYSRIEYVDYLARVYEHISWGLYRKQAYQKALYMLTRFPKLQPQAALRSV